MECPYCHAKESTQFRLIGGSDDPQAKPMPYAYMVYQCECDAICKRNIWSHQTEVWISGSNEDIQVRKGCKDDV